MSVVMSAAKSIFSVPYWLAYHAWTAFLFTKSDIKTTLIPITALAAASAPLASLKQLPPTMFWIWLILLQFNLSNQTVSPAEDQNNKPDRPLPAGRLSYRSALILRWLMPFVCLAWSYSYSKEVAAACLVGCFLTWVYNEAGFASGHWAGRNIVNGLGMASFETAASLIAGKSVHSLDNITIFAIICSAAIFATTIQAQDFKDTIGDALVGRRTLPLVHPSIARPTLMLAVAAWSIGLSKLWGLNMETALMFNALGLAVGGCFLAKNSVKADQRSFYLYNVWLSLAHALPAYFRFVATAPMA
ncbi:hypothetical protein ACEPAH_1361 [Sanghuangporus vaninii]